MPIRSPRHGSGSILGPSGSVSLEDLLRERTAEGTLAETLPGGKVHCYACAHRCLIPEGRKGICKIRYNQEGKLRVPRGYVSGLQVDPIEKKPFFHAFPGSPALSFGMLGCDLHCSFCQNWITSQAIRDPSAVASITEMESEALVGLAVKHGAPVVASTYNEPLITTEWAIEIFRRARQAGLRTAYISNGNATPEVLEALKPWLDLINVDLKAFSDRSYRKLGGLLKDVLETIESLFRMGFWLEIVTLVVPGLNDTEEELREIARFISGVSPEIPWHVTAFHQNYKMMDREGTRGRALLRAAEIGVEEGLRFVYAGNIPGAVGEWENTRCPSCDETVIRRAGFSVVEYRLRDGRCPDCSAPVPGRWKNG